MATPLTPRQAELLRYLEERLTTDGRIPSLRQAAAELGISHAAVAQHLATLEKKGYLRRSGRYSREVALLAPATPPANWRRVPVIGRIQAGLPMYAQQEHDGSIVVDGDLFGGDYLFALRVKGDSMRDAGILAGDLVICRPQQYAEDGDIVVALIEHEEATVKRFYRHPDHIELRPANPAYPVMRYDFHEVLIQGRVIGLQRRLVADDR